MLLGSSSEDDDLVGNAHARLVLAAYDIAQAALDTQPLWLILSFMHSSSASATALIPDDRSALRKRISQYSRECMFILTIYAKECGATVSTLYDDICTQGFSSQLRAVLCADHYCQWLNEHDRSEEVDAAVERAARHITHPHFQMELQSAVDRLKSRRTLATDGKSEDTTAG